MKENILQTVRNRLQLFLKREVHNIHPRKQSQQQSIDNVNAIRDFNSLMLSIRKNEQMIQMINSLMVKKQVSKSYAIKRVLKRKGLTTLFKEKEKQINKMIEILIRRTSPTAPSILQDRAWMLDHYLFAIENLFNQHPTREESDRQLKLFELLTGDFQNELLKKAEGSFQEKHGTFVNQLLASWENRKKKAAERFAKMKKFVTTKKSSPPEELESQEDEGEELNFDFYGVVDKKPKVPLQESWELIWDQINENN